MQTFLIIASVVSLVFGGLIVVLNWSSIVANYQLQRKGTERHISATPAVAQILVLMSALISSRISSPVIPDWLFWAVALSDAALLQILYLPISVLVRKYRGQT